MVLRKISLAVVALLASLLMLEGLVRLFWPQDLSGSFSVLTRTGLVINKSQGVTRHQFGDRVHHYRFYEPGLRGTPIPQSGVKILVLGDSYTFGWLLDHDDTYVAQLQRKADQAFGQGTFVFLNAGGPGWGTAAELAYLEDFGPQIAPDIVLVFLNSGDIGRSIQHRIYSPVPDRLGELRRNKIPHSGLKRAVNAIPGYHWSLEHSHLVQLARHSVSKRNLEGHPPQARPLIEGPGVSDPGFSKGVARVFGRVLFNRMNEWCNQNGASLWVTTTGWFDAVSQPSNTPTLAFMEDVDEFFQQLGVPFVDLAPAVFAQKESAPDDFIIAGEGHPSERGAELIADSAFDHFLASELAAYCATSIDSPCREQ